MIQEVEELSTSSYYRISSTRKRALRVIYLDKSAEAKILHLDVKVLNWKTEIET